MIRGWLTNELVLKKAKNPITKRHMRGYKPLYPELDAQVFEYLCDERAAGRPASNKQLIAKAKETGPTLNVDRSFKASNMWLKSWKWRTGVSLRCATNDSQKVPVEYWDVLHAFRSNIVQLRIKHGIPRENVFNMDQTMCQFDMVPNRTISMS